MKQEGDANPLPELAEPPKGASLGLCDWPYKALKGLCAHAAEER